MSIPFTFDSDLHICRDLKGNLIPTSTQVLEAMRLSFNFKKYVEADLLDWRTGIGSRVHHLCNLHNQHGDLDPTWIDMDSHGYVESFTGWKRLSGFVPQQWGTRRCELINGLALSGETDMEGLLNVMVKGVTLQRPAIIDLKTGAKSDSHGLQLASYEQLKYRSAKIGREIRAVVYLNADGSPGNMVEYGEFSKVDGTSYADTFLSALYLLHWSMRRGYFGEKDIIDVL